MAVRSSPLSEARDAYERHAWRSAAELFQQALADGQRLAASDLERLGKACWWIGDRKGCLDAHEMAYARYLADGDRRLAARCAQMLRFNYINGVGDRETGRGWSARAAKLLEGLPECSEHGYQLRIEGHGLCTSGRPEEGFLLYEQALEIGRRLNDPDLVALTDSWRSMDLLAAGRLDDGFALVDEVSAAAIGGELGPFATGVVLCNAISAYRDSGDFGAAGEWAERASRWCERQAIHGFPGICRVRRAEVMRVRGAWADAEREARAASEELERFLVAYAAEAYLELGEIRLRVGDPNGAEAAFRQAHALGHDPQPGQALLLLSRGEADAATHGLKRALENSSLTIIERARMLEALVEVALASGRGNADAAARELEAMAETNPREALRAMALRARAAIDLAGGSSATSVLRSVLQLWRSVDAPYEVARTRTLLADSYCVDGDPGGASQDLEAAAAVFERLGAIPDLTRARDKLAGLPGSRLPHANRTFLFSDIVDSTRLAETLGDEPWANLLRWHDTALRTLFAQHRGEEVDHAGDGFLVAFDSAATATACAVAIQRMLSKHRIEHGFAPRVRIGVHAADAVRSGRGFRGSGVHQAARIAALAGADEILASREAAEAGGVNHVEGRVVELKGIARPVEVVSLAWQ